MASFDQTFPFETRGIETAQVEELRKCFKGKVRPSVVRYGPKGYLLPREFATIGRSIYNMKVRPDDTFVVTFPRSGNTWTQELVWLIANNFDFESAKKIALTSRYSFLDLAAFINTEVTEKMPNPNEKVQDETNITAVEQVSILPSPRFIKSHLPLSLLPPKLLRTCKVVYVSRDPRDVAVSLFHHFRLIKTCNDDVNFKTFWRFFFSDLVAWTPFFSHNQEAWELRHHPNMLFMFYEELSKDLAACARRVAKFLNTRITDEQTQQLCDHLNIKNFKENKAVNLESLKEFGELNENESFIRNGKVGGWREYFDEEMTQQAEQWMQRNLQNTDFRFPQ